MRSATGYFVASALVAIVAVSLAGYGFVEQRIAEADGALGTYDLRHASGLYAALRSRLQVTERIPWLMRETRATVEAGQAQTRYWRGEHAVLVAEYPNLGATGTRDNLPLQLTVANAHVRALDMHATEDTPSLLNALDRAIAIYQQVLRNTEGHRDAAYNYEYLVLLRAEIAAGDGMPAQQQSGPLGTPGGSGDDDMDMLGDLNDVQIYVPSDMLGRESTDEPTIGSDAPLRRRG